MKKRKKRGNVKNKWLFYSPRILTVLFIAFMSMFAFDVFEEYNFPTVLLALFIHLIPSILLAIVLLIAWKWEKIGGIVFITLGFLYIILTWSRFSAEPGFEFLITYLLISGPAILIGILFFLSFKYNKK